MTMTEARARLAAVTAEQSLNNCVWDACTRLREKLELAELGPVGRGPEDEAPDYVMCAVRGLESWLKFV